MRSLADMPRTLRELVEARDADGVVALLADDVVFRSPVTDTPIVGREGVGALLRAVIGAFESLEYTDELRSGDVEVLVLDAVVGGREVHAVDVIRYDDATRIKEFTVYGRPMSAVAAFAAAAGPAMAEHHGPVRRAAASALVRPLPTMLARADRVAMRVIGPRGMAT